MKKHLLNSFLLAIGLPLATLAQPVLTATGINPVIGEQYVIKYGNYASPGSAGAGQTWNLSGITPASTGNYTAGAVASAPNSGLFSSTSNIQVNDGSVYSFLNVSSGAYQNSGSIAGGVNFVYSNNEDIIHFPFNMNDAFSDPWAATFTSSSITFTRTGTTAVTYDGYGTLTTPAGTYSNVARLHVVQNYQDVASFGSINYTNDEYIWFMNNYHQALAGVTSLTMTSTFTNNVTQTGFYAGNASVPTSLQTENEMTQVKLFPNPASEQINIMLKNGLSIKTISLYDQLGKLVNEQKIEDGQNALVTIPLGDFANGIYHARIVGSNGDVYTQKISVVRKD